MSAQKRNPPVQLSLSHSQANLVRRLLRDSMMSYDIGGNTSQLKAKDRIKLEDVDYKLQCAIGMATIYPIRIKEAR